MPWDDIFRVVGHLSSLPPAGGDPSSVAGLCFVLYGLGKPRLSSFKDKNPSANVTASSPKP